MRYTITGKRRRYPMPTPRNIHSAKASDFFEICMEDSEAYPRQHIETYVRSPWSIARINNEPAALPITLSRYLSGRLWSDQRKHLQANADWIFLNTSAKTKRYRTVKLMTVINSRGTCRREAPSSIPCIVVVAERRMINESEMMNLAKRDRPKINDSQYILIPNGKENKTWYAS